MSKASKFTMVNPGQEEEMAITADNVNRYMENAVEDLRTKYANKGQEEETSVDAPTGSAYAEKNAEEIRQERAKEKKEQAKIEQMKDDARKEEINEQMKCKDMDDSDDEFMDDPELERIRMQRMNEMRSKKTEHMNNLSKGHGQYREISQDEFLPEVTSSETVICHFYHNDFFKCKVIDKHMGILAPQHVESKFLKINAEKAPFFVSKLQISVLPTIVVFKDGIAEEHIHGYEGMLKGTTKGCEDEFPTRNLAERLSDAKAIKYTPPPTDEELDKFGLKMRSSIRAKHMISDDYDFDD